jgi:hypothetical protein
MKHLWIVGLTMVVGLTGASAQACGRRYSCAAPACETPCAPTTVTWVDKEITCYKPVTETKDVPVTVTKWVPKEVTTTRKCTVYVPEYKDVAREITVCVPHTKWVEQTVTCTKLAPTCVVDPCTGCVHTYCQPVSYTQKVMSPVCEVTMEKKTITERVCNMKPEEKTYEVKTVICEAKTETVVTKQSFTRMEAYKTTIKVAVCVPAPPPPPAPACAPPPACAPCP